jgi:hypothetical protein
MYYKALNITNMKWLGIANQIFTVSGTTLVATFANLVFDNAAASMFVQGTNTLTLKNTAGSAKFTAMAASSITVAASTTVTGGLTGPVTNAGTISGDITGNVVNSGTIDGANITGNVTQATPTNLTGVTITGNYTFNTNTPITVVFTGATITGTVSNSGTALVTITLASGATVGTAGSNVVTQRFANVTAPNIIVGSRVQLYDTTNNVELFNGVLSASLNYQHTFVGNITVRLRATYQSGLTAKLPFLALGSLTATGLEFLGVQEDDTVYASYGIDGSAVTGFTADYVNTEINLSMATNFTVASLYAWWVYNTTTSQGIAAFFQGLTAQDAGNIQINTSIVDLYLDNTTATFIYQTDTMRLFRTDGAYPARTVTSGGGGIDVNWKNNVYIVDATPALTLPQFLALQNP